MVGNNNNTNKTVTSYILTINWLEIDWNYYILNNNNDNNNNNNNNT